MDLESEPSMDIPPPNPKALLRQYGLRADKKLGQNFLIDQSALKRVVRAAELTGDETVLEIGAGLGSLTYFLSSVAYRVIAVEFDQRLINALDTVLEPLGNVELIAGDILSLDIEDLLAGEPYAIVANIPYNITSVLIRRILESPKSAFRIVLTVQQEVAERIVAQPGEYSLLALSVQLYGIPQVMGHIPARSFYPQPKVDSAILKIDVHETPVVDPTLIPILFQLARAAFNQKRKKLRNSISAGMGVETDTAIAWLNSCGIDPSSRPQELGVEAWSELARVVQEDRAN